MAERIVGFGYYKIVEEIGEGGFGTVYKALHRLLEQPVALKTLHTFLTKEPKFNERFFREAETHTKLKHPNIVLVHNFFQEEGRYYIVMEYLEGMPLPDGRMVRTVADLIKEGPLPEDRVLSIFQQILGAVSYAHSLGILHLDIKPSNILFTPQGEVKVTDFGIARIVSGERVGIASEIRVGTAPYMSPEQILNKRLGKSSDIYSLGILFYEMVTGTLPFQKREDSSIEEQHLFSPPPKMREKNPKVRESWEVVVEKALAKKPEDRFQSCEEFLSALTQPAVTREVVVKPKTIPCPSLVGKSKEDAELLAQNAKLNLILEGEESSEIIPEGLILYQTPEPGTLLGEGEEVKIITSKGKEVKILTVPALVGKDKKEAEKMLADLGLKLKIESEEFSETVPANFVINQIPKPGERLTLGESVRIIISKGKKPPVIKIVKVPSLIGKERNEAEGIIRDLGLRLVMEKEDYSETVAEGCVLGQSPLAGENVKEGETIKVILSKGKRLVLCPRLIGKRENDAEAEAKKNKLGIEIIGEDYSDEMPAGAILNQIPPPGAQLKEGDIVRIKLSKGPLLIEVPQITDKTEDEARSILANIGLELAVEGEEYSEKVPMGKVLSQFPPPGESVRKGSVVKVILSKGERLIEVPLLTGKERDEAEKILAGLGLNYQLANEEFSETVPVNFIISQIPKPGAKLKPGETVRISLSKGKKPPVIKLVKVPSVIGKDKKTAEEFLAKLNFRLIIEEEYSEKFPSGIIFRQTPEPGQEVKEGEVIRITESKGPELIKVPLLIGEERKSAERILSSLGLKLSLVGEEFSEELPSNSILNQTPPAGTKLKPGEEVKIIISKGKRLIKAPSLIGKPLAEAEKEVAKVGLKLVVTGEDFSGAIPKNSIIIQNPNPGIDLSPGEDIRVILSKGKKAAEKRVVVETQKVETLLDKKEKKGESIPKVALIGLGIIFVLAFSLFLALRSPSKAKRPSPIAMTQSESINKIENLPGEILTEEEIKPETAVPKRPKVETLARRPETVPILKPKLETVPAKPPTETTPPPSPEETSVPIVPYAKVEIKPNPISIPTPEYPEMARRARIEGQTIVKVLVDVDGSIVDAQILKSSGNDALDEAALIAARKAKFTPARQKDIPVKVWVSIPFNFYLKR